MTSDVRHNTERGGRTKQPCSEWRERHAPRVRGGAGGEVRLGEDDEVPGLGAESEEESPEAVVGGEDAPGAADGAGARGVERAQQAQDLGEHVGGDGVERAQRQRAVVLVLLRAMRLRAAGPRVAPRRCGARQHGAPHLAEQHRHASARWAGWVGRGSEVDGHGLGQQILPSARTAGNEDGRGKGDKDNSSRRGRWRAARAPLEGPRAPQRLPAVALASAAWQVSCSSDANPVRTSASSAIAHRITNQPKLFFSLIRSFLPHPWRVSIVSDVSTIVITIITPCDLARRRRDHATRLRPLLRLRVAGEVGLLILGFHFQQATTAEQSEIFVL